MKYIRTKDGKLYDMNEVGIDENIKEQAYIHKPTLDVIYVKNIIKQADTIEKLCDEFVDVYKDKRKKERTIIPAKRFVKWQVNLKKYDVYGAIWTDKGLIYVAKMNEKGELELL